MIFIHELTNKFRTGWPLLTPYLFTVGGCLLFVLATGPDTEIHATLSQGIIWTLVLFTFFLSLSQTFTEDYEDGTLDHQYLTTPSLVPYFIRKALVHWILSGVPLLLIAPCLLYVLKAPSSSFLPMILSLLLATPSLSLIGILCETLTLGSRPHLFLSTLILLPFSIPLLVFASSLGQSSPTEPEGQLAILLLLAYLCAAMALCPLLGSLSLKQGIHDA